MAVSGKKTHQINVKMTEEMHDAIVAYANSMNLSASEYLSDLAIDDLKSQFAKLRVLQKIEKVFDNYGNESTESTE